MSKERIMELARDIWKHGFDSANSDGIDFCDQLAELEDVLDVLETPSGESK